jgi:hypothetical protein
MAWKVAFMTEIDRNAYTTWKEKPLGRSQKLTDNTKMCLLERPGSELDSVNSEPSQK